MIFLVLLLSLTAWSWASVEENIGVDDPNLFEGDMILTPEQRQAAMNGGDVSTAGARGSIKRGLWTGGVVYYTIDGSLKSSSKAMAAIRAGMKMWEDNTCIKFVQRTNQRHYANFYKGRGCSSYVGMTGGRQQISLAWGCWSAGIAAHEMGHALGFYHEQSRPDRDDYVEIIWGNIQSGMSYNFKKYTASMIDSLNTPYDYGSIMHYDSKAFGGGRVTIRPKKSGVTLGNRRYISKIDIQQMNLLYKCSGGGVTLPPSTQPPSGCSNDHDRCEEWEKRGECRKNPYYMLHNCKLSCGVCGNEKCENYHKNWEHWTNIGYCTNQKWKNRMAKWCRKACKLCGGGPVPPTPPPPTNGPVPPNPPPTTNTPPVPGSCGVKPNVRIVGGTEAPKNAWPWQAMLTTSGGGQFCGGTLIHPQWVLSASHCVSGKRAFGVKIRMGAHYKRGSVGTEQTISVQKIIMHPQYNRPRRYAHDIALLKLSSPAKLNKAVGLACLPSDNVAGFEPGKKCWITGWGRLASGGASTNVLMQASVPIKSHSACQRSYPRQIHESMVCAGLDQGGVDTCQGDSGGPMVCEHSGKYYVQGATSWGHGCAAAGKFGVYAKVRYVRKWLLQIMATN